MSKDANPPAEFTWVPKRTMQQCNQILHGPGAPLEVQSAVVNGRVLKVFKPTPPNLRLFFLGSVQKNANADYLVFEDERYTYKQTFDAASRAASIFRDVYDVHKGDRVAIVMRNYNEWVIAYWAAHLLGAVPVCVNAFSPGPVISHCLTLTTPKVIILDAQRAVRLTSHLADIQAESEATGIFVVIKRSHDGEKTTKAAMKLKDVDDWDKVMGPNTKHEKIATSESWKKESPCEWGDDGSIFFTSGTTGMPKGVLAHQLGNLTSAFQGIINVLRATLRRGEIPDLATPPPLQKSFLLTIPLFHVTGCMAVLLGSTLLGGKIVLMRKWDVEQGIDLLIKEKITTTGGVPSIALDLLENEKFLKTKTYLDLISYGGAPAPPQIARNVPKLHDGGVANGQGYGLTETCAGCINVCGEDSTARPLSTGLPFVTTDLLIIDPKTQKECAVGEIGEIWMHGPQVMNGYYKNPKATNKVLTKDGWFNSEDLGYVDKEGFLYIKGRVKDLIIRGGENIDAVSVENAFYDDERVLSCAAVGVPDQRLGELPAAFVVPKHGMDVTEEELLAGVRERLPAFAVPVMVLVSKAHAPLPTNPAGKILKDPLRAQAKASWENRKRAAKKAAKSKNKL
ncbi:long-chain-fatty-acid-CoA ligase [Clavulina sp. PMI_390]|nr:long-chain-fatty-acid-CoA ligase [Clavulina sp. PMI_390]